MTLRRVELGAAVRTRTYACLDGLFGLPLGTVKRALSDDALLAELGHGALGGAARGDEPPEAWVLRHARAATPATLLPAPAAADTSDLAAAAALIDRLRRYDDPAVTAAVVALAAAMPVLATGRPR